MVNWYCYRLLFSGIGSKIGSKINALMIDNQILVLKRLDCAIEGQRYGILKQWLVFSYEMNECLKVI